MGFEAISAPILLLSLRVIASCQAATLFRFPDLPEDCFGNEVIISTKMMCPFQGHGLHPSGLQISTKAISFFLAVKTEKFRSLQFLHLRQRQGYRGRWPYPLKGSQNLHGVSKIDFLGDHQDLMLRSF
jgi:hypothetical protein